MCFREVEKYLMNLMNAKTGAVQHEGHQLVQCRLSRKLRYLDAERQSKKPTVGIEYKQLSVVGVIV